MFTQRCYKNENDQLAMAALAQQFSKQILHTTDLPYRLSSWALDDPLNTCLWEDEHGKLVAWAVLQRPFCTLDFAVQVEHSALFHHLLAWADERAEGVLNTPYGLSSWYVNIFSDQSEIIQQLEAAGYACQADVGEDSWSKVWMERAGNVPVKEYRIPPGFIVRPLAGEGEVEAYVELHQSVFQTKNMTVEWRHRMLQHPHHTPSLDLVVEAPGGRLVAFCIGWLCHHEGKNGGLCAQVEPLGCHADFRHYALGRVALAEVLRRMREFGVTYIFVETDSYRDTAFRLYESMGFEVVRDVLVYRKDYA